MLSLADCLDFIDVDPETVDVIAEHQSMSVSVATGLADNLVADAPDAPGIDCEGP